MSVKYIKLPLPRGAGGMAPGFYLTFLRQVLTEWIGTKPVTFTLEPRKDYHAELKFSDPHYYTLFTVSWVSERIWNGYEIIS